MVVESKVSDGDRPTIFGPTISKRYTTLRDATAGYQVSTKLGSGPNEMFYEPKWRHHEELEKAIHNYVDF